MELNKDYFKQMAKQHYGVEMPKVEKVSFGDVMFNIEQKKHAYNAKIRACEEMLIEYTQSDNELDVCMKHTLQGRIDTYKEAIQHLDEIQHAIYKKVL
jgi:glycyl-tRNA synthetase alpha subunit